MRAVSATVVVSEPRTLVLLPVGPGIGMRPWLHLWPSSPVNDAGMRMEPPPSDAVPKGMIPAATAAAVPPLEPPGVRVVSHGLRVMPCTLVLVKLSVPNSGVDGLAHGHRAGRLQPSDVDVVVGFRAPTEEGNRAVVGRHPFAPLEILHPEGHPGEGTWVVAARHDFVDRRCSLSGEIGIEMDERVQPLVARFDPRQVFVEHLDGLALASAHGLGQLDDRWLGVIAHTARTLRRDHGCSPAGASTVTASGKTR